jgi:uncharacterized protein YjeT (DUF2065 family)
VKGLLYFLVPGLAAKSMARVAEEQAWQFRVAGLAALLLGLLIGWIALGGDGQPASAPIWTI